LANLIEWKQNEPEFVQAAFERVQSHLRKLTSTRDGSMIYQITRELQKSWAEKAVSKVCFIVCRNSLLLRPSQTIQGKERFIFKGKISDATLQATEFAREYTARVFQKAQEAISVILQHEYSEVYKTRVTSLKNTFQPFSSSAHFIEFEERINPNKLSAQYKFSNPFVAEHTEYPSWDRLSSLFSLQQTEIPGIFRLITRKKKVRRPSASC
jgi:hypothetical protein